MDDQTVSLKLHADAVELKREVLEAGQAMDDMAGAGTQAGQQVERVLSGMSSSASRTGDDVRTLDSRLEALSGADRDVLIRAEIDQAEADIRRIDRAVGDVTLSDHEIRILVDERNQASAHLDELEQQFGDVDRAAEEVDQTVSGIDWTSLAGAGALAGATAALGEAATSTGRLRAQLGMTADEAREFDQVAKEVYRRNYGETMAQAGDVTAGLVQNLELADDRLQATAEGVFAISDAFETMDPDTLIRDLGVMRANFPGTDEAEALDLIADAMQTMGPRAHDLQDTLEEYPGDFAEIGLSADDMFRILIAGSEAGIRNTDLTADAIREMGVQITDTSSNAGEALEGMFGAERADRLVRNFARGGEAGRDAFFEIVEGLGQVEDPLQRNSIAVDLFGARVDDMSAQLPGWIDGLGEVESGNRDVEGSVADLDAQYAGFGDRLSGWMRTLETTVGGVGDVLGPAAEAASGLGTGFLLARGAGIELTDVLGAVRGGARRARTGMATTARFMTGPWGIALATAGGALAMIQGRMESVGQAASTLRDDLDGVAASVDTLSDEWLIQELRQRDVLGAAGDLGIEMETIREAVAGNAEAEDELTRKLGGRHAVTAGLVQALPGLRSEEFDLLRVIEELQSGTERYNRELDAQSTLSSDAQQGARDLAPTIDMLRDPFDRSAASASDLEGTVRRLRDPFDRAGDGATGLRGVLGDLGVETEETEDETESLRESIEGLHSAMEILDDGARDVDETYSTMQANLDSLAEAIDENGNTLDRHTEKGRSNRDALRQSLQSVEDHAAALYDQNGSIDEAVAAADRHYDAVIDEAVAMGMSRDAAREYAEQLGFTPDQVETALVLQDERANLDHETYLRQLGLTPDEVETAMQVLAEQGETALFRYLDNLGLTPEQVDTLMEVLDEDANARLNTLITRFESIPRHIAVQIAVHQSTIRSDQNLERINPGGGGPSFMHEGGTVEHTPETRRLGQVMGLAADEVPTVLQTGEEVTPRRLVESGGPAGGADMSELVEAIGRLERHVGTSKETNINVAEVRAHDYQDFRRQMAQDERMAALAGERP